MTRPVSPLSARSGGGGSPERVDFDTYILRPHTQRSIQALPDAAKEELRTYRSKEGEGHEYQQKMSDFHWPKHGQHSASGEDFLELLPGYDENRLEEQIGEITRKLPGWCNPCIEARAMLTGIKHEGDKEEDQGKLWNVPRALNSKKHKYLRWLQDNLDGHGCTASGELLFGQLFPNTRPGIDGEVPLTRIEKQDIQRVSALMRTDFDLAKHLIQNHDGEARLAINGGFNRFPDNVDIRAARFWDYQYAKSGEVRKWLLERHKRCGEAPLAETDILWCLRKEYDKSGSYQTTILRWEPDAGINPASRGTTLENGTWSIRSGNYLTLAELFFYGAREATCFHLYKMYLSLDYYIYKRQHSESMSEDAQRRRAAKRLHHQEHGRWKLPNEGDVWSPAPLWL